MEYTERIIMLLRAARKASGLTLKDLADRIGCSPAVLSRFENGKYNIDYVNAYRINVLNEAEAAILEELLKEKKENGC